VGDEGGLTMDMGVTTVGNEGGSGAIRWEWAMKVGSGQWRWEWAMKVGVGNKGE